MLWLYKLFSVLVSEDDELWCNIDETSRRKWMANKTEELKDMHKIIGYVDITVLIEDKQQKCFYYQSWDNILLLSPNLVWFDVVLFKLVSFFQFAILSFCHFFMFKSVVLGKSKLLWTQNMHLWMYSYILWYMCTWCICHWYCCSYKWV